MRRRLSAALIATLVAGSAAGATASASAATTADSVSLKAGGAVSITYRGNGHGHGMSQYGAYGAALAGLGTAKILAHYYPGTSLATLHSGAMLRIKLSDTGSATVVFAGSGMSVTGVRGTLPTKGVSRYRLVADSGSGLTLQRMGSARGSQYVTVQRGLPDNARFVRANRQPLRLLLTDGTSTWYKGCLRAVRKSDTGSAAGVATVNLVGYNDYAAGVTPREMPASWSSAATAAQAVAARTYAVYEQRHAAGRYYDLCDTSMCQVYGGYQHLDRAGEIQWTDLPQAAAATSNQVLTYRGEPIFAQYSASNGGWTTAGGQPYLKAAADQYDPGRSGDPYVNATRTVSGGSIASYYGLASVSKIVVTKRDGHGTWGGRVISATVSGKTRAGKATTVTTTGDDLQWALGLGTTWLRLGTS